MDPYQVLGASPDADVETLRAHYRRMVREHHPDLAQGEAARARATALMVEINSAWHLVSDPQRRAAHDARASARARWEQMDEARRNIQSAPVANLAQDEAKPAWMRERELRELRERERQEMQQRAARQHVLRAERQQSVRELNEVLQARLQENAGGKRKLTPNARRQLREALRLFREEDRPGEAIALCQQVLRVDNRNVSARELLGDFYLQLGRADRALPLWEQALMLQPENSAVKRKLAALNPHDARSYKPQPRIPRRGSDFDARAAQLLPRPRRSLWRLLRARLFGRF